MNVLSQWLGFFLVLLLVTAEVVVARTFTWAFQGDVSTMDPHDSGQTATYAFLSSIYEPLVGRDGDMNVIPVLAERWERVSPKVWRFYLREGVRFHNGNAFDADDVVFSAQRANSRDGISKTYEKAVKVSQYVVDLHTPGINPLLPQQISYFYVMDKSWAQEHVADKWVLNKRGEQVDYFFHHTNGTGPYVLVNWEEGVEARLERYPGWWRESKGNVTEAVFRPIPNSREMYRALVKGEVDLAYPIPVPMWRHVEEHPSVEMLTGMELRTLFLGMDQAREELLYSSVKGRNPFKDLRVRQAMRLAIDSHAINRKIMRHAAHPTELMVAKGVSGYDAGSDVSVKSNTREAWRLLKEAGYHRGFDVTLDCPNNRYVNDEKICHMVASMLAKVGVRVTVNAMPKNQFFKKIFKKGGYDTSFYLLGWAPSTFDAFNTVRSILSCRSEGFGLYNIGGYCNPRVSELVKEIEFELEPERRQQLFNEVFNLHKADVGHIPIHNQPLSWGIRKGVEVEQRPDNFMLLSTVVVP